MRADMSNLIMKRKVKLYDNLVESEGCYGRLSATFKIYPAPQISWEFEALGEDACRPDESPVSFQGTSFRVEQGQITSKTYGHKLGEPTGTSMEGIARKAYFGSPDDKFAYFQFYFPNCRFQQVHLVGQKHINIIHRAIINDKQQDFDRGTAGRFVRAHLDFGWSVHLETRKEALDWLNPNALNFGTYITTVGSLYRDEEHERTLQPSNSVVTLTLNEAKEIISQLSLLLAFANGGWIGPLYMEGSSRREDGFEIAGVYTVERTTPIENLGRTWLTIDSNLETFLECFPNLKAMVSKKEWGEVFELILIWYFQAIQPQSLQVKGKPWPILANALGALLERISVTIAVKELGLRGLSDNKKRITALLHAIGVDEDERCINEFVDLRNDATHPTGKPQKSVKVLTRIIERATQWAEEALLWRLGYVGKYRDRRQSKYSAIEPRYDISKRHKDW